MIGIIISGHGNFASGLQSSLKLIAGESTNIEFVDFIENDTIESLKEKFLTSIKNLTDCDEILALTDLAGGSPFKTIAELSFTSDKNIKVIGGTNLPMVLEISMTKDIFDDLSSLSSSALEIGKNGVVQFELQIREEKNNCEDGI